MLNLKENMKNFKNTKTQSTIGDSRTITGGERGDWHVYQRHDEKIHVDVIPGLHANIFRVTQALQMFSK